MSVNLIQNFSFEDGLAGWSTSGPVTTATPIDVFERATLAELGQTLLPGDTAIISQLVPVPPEATHFHVVYAVKPQLINVGDLEVQVEFRGSANLDPPLPLRRRDVIDVINSGALTLLAWQTRYAVTGEIPPDTAWARLRFIHPGTLLGVLQIDAVYMTTD